MRWSTLREWHTQRYLIALDEGGANILLTSDKGSECAG